MARKRGFGDAACMYEGKRLFDGKVRDGREREKQKLDG